MASWKQRVGKTKGTSMKGRGKYGISAKPSKKKKRVLVRGTFRTKAKATKYMKTVRKKYPNWYKKRKPRIVILK